MNITPKLVAMKATSRISSNNVIANINQYYMVYRPYGGTKPPQRGAEFAFFEKRVTRVRVGFSELLEAHFLKYLYVAIIGTENRTRKTKFNRTFLEKPDANENMVSGINHTNMDTVIMLQAFLIPFL
jgi:hypothetical protein